MSETIASIRLSKASREFNVSTNHIVEFLATKGIIIENNPNAKIAGDALEFLLQEFQSDSELKKAAQKITDSKLKKDTAVVADSGSTSHIVTQKEEAEKPALTVKETSVSKKKEETASKEKETKAKRKIAEDKEKEEKERGEVIKAKGKITGPKIVDKIEIEESDKEKRQSKKKKKEEEEKESKKKTSKKKSTEKEETTDIVTPVMREEDIIAPPAEIKSIEQAEELYRVKRDKPTGPVILRKIDLPTEPERKKASPDADKDDSKRKRKRKDKKKVDVKKEISTNKFTRPFSPAPHQRRPRPTALGPTEITSKDIDERIRQTMERLKGGSGGKKGAKARAHRQFVLDEQQAETEASSTQRKKIKATEFVTVSELAKMMNVQVNEIISACMSLGMFVSINQRLDAETLTVVADAFDHDVEFVSADVQEAIREADQDNPEDLIPRPPIVTVMGHVDHGKTSLLDYIRKANVIAGEAGGITQHIGAYEVTLDSGKMITFLDTPGHEAFTAMRARGAKVTDVAIIVIAADDSVMPQTVEAINHAQAAGVPLVFAFNKTDRAEANPERIKEQLSKMNILVEDWGGKFQSQDISAKTGKNIDVLLDKVLLEAELLDMKANPNRNASGTIIEASLDKGRGYVTTILVQKGTLKIGDVLLAGCHSGKVKAMFNERNVRITEAGPSAPAQVLGLTGAPQAGDLFTVMDDEREAREIATRRLQLQREQGIRTTKHITLDEIGRRLAVGNFKELNLIVKGDVDGSIEALTDQLLKLSNPQIEVNVIHKSVGQITESDVLLASASNAIIIGFQVRPSINARKLAEKEQIDIRLYSIIYNAINEVKDGITGMLAPEFQEKITCNVEIREVFNITKGGTIAGCMVTDGKITRNTSIRVIRDGIVVHSGELASLKRFKDDAKEVTSGYECGLGILNFNDIKAGDVIEGYEQVEVARK
ncbi:MAG: translation initiation factor IF-2 [Bacteroidia bacterium]|nr:translation initiation factor IF-2 [Bacteroidia bacterium]